MPFVDRKATNTAEIQSLSFNGYWSAMGVWPPLREHPDRREFLMKKNISKSSTDMGSITVSSMALAKQDFKMQ